jgi:hypothetical protein
MLGTMAIRFASMRKAICVLSAVVSIVVVGLHDLTVRHVACGCYSDRRRVRETRLVLSFV